MNYPESKQILEGIKKAKKILVNCHYTPDPDSVASCLAFYLVLTGMGKNVTMISPSGLQEEIKFLKNSEKIRKVDLKNFDFAEFDLFLVPDCSSWLQVTGDKDISIPRIPIISIDHHLGSGAKEFTKTNLLDGRVSSTCEILFNLFKDWNVTLDKDLATTLLTGIYSDTGGYQFSTTKISTMYVSGELMKKGADINYIVFNLLRSLEPEILSFWGDILTRIKIDKEYKFAWSALDYSIVSKYSKINKAKSTAASLFIRVIKDTEFGIVMVEDPKGVLSVSFRERFGFDVSRIAAELGGGGHRAAAGATIEGLPFAKAVEKVLKIARKHARQRI